MNVLFENNMKQCETNMKKYYFTILNFIFNKKKIFFLTFFLINSR